jgi:hypothetical protein
MRLKFFDHQESIHLRDKMDTEFYSCLLLLDFTFLYKSRLKAYKFQKESEILLQNHLSDQVAPKSFDKCHCCDKVQKNYNRIELFGQG